MNDNFFYLTEEYDLMIVHLMITYIQNKAK